MTYAAVAALIASLMPLGARYGWAFDLAANFRVQYVVRRTRCSRSRARSSASPSGVSSLAACAVLQRTAGAAVCSAADRCRRGSGAVSQHTIKLLSANVLFENHSAKRLLEIVREESPDIVLLVEYTPEWAAQVGELRAAYPYYLEGPVQSPWGIALFSRFEFDSSKAIPVGPSNGVQASVRTPDGPLMVIGVHLASPTTPWRAAVRNSQLDSLATRVARVTRTASRRRRLEHHAVLAVLPGLARTHRAHRHSPRAHAEPQLAGAVADRRHPDRSLRGEPRRA